jgi:hypothetical protein
MTSHEDPEGRLSWPDRIRLFFLLFVAMFILAFVVDSPNSVRRTIMDPIGKHPWASALVLALLLLFVLFLEANFH